MDTKNTRGDASEQVSVIRVLAQFSMRGLEAFISHAETLSLFQRALVRANVPVRYTQGFNPRPKMSVSLPRPVGVESDGDLLALSLESRGGYQFDREEFVRAVSAELPDGCLLKWAFLQKGKSAPKPEAADYVFTIRPEAMPDGLRDRTKELMEAGRLEVERRIDAKGRTRVVDVRPYIESIAIEGTAVVVRCLITPGGSIRVEEIMDLLQISVDMLESRIRRSNIRWSGYCNSARPTGRN